MICEHCGEQVEEGKQFCPYCGQPASGEVVESHQVPLGAETALEQTAAGRREPYAEAEALLPPRPAPMSGFERGAGQDDKSRRTIYIAVAAASVILVGLLAFWASRPAARPAEPRLEGAIRADSPEFAQINERLRVEFDADENASEAERAIGDIVMVLEPTIRNFTGRTVDSVELRASVVDLSGQPVKERTVVRQINLEPNKVTKVPINLEGFKASDVRANAKVELTGVKFK